MRSQRAADDSASSELHAIVNVKNANSENDNAERHVLSTTLDNGIFVLSLTRGREGKHSLFRLQKICSRCHQNW